MLNIKMALYGLKTSDLVAKSLHIEGRVTGNPLFATALPLVAQITTEREELETRMGAAAMGDRIKIASRKEQEKILGNLLRKLGTQVSILAENESELLSSGFELRNQPRAAVSLERPAALEVKRSDMEGQLLLNWVPVRGSRQYVVEFRQPGLQQKPWITAVYTSKSAAKIDQLTPGTTYEFRVRALGTNGMSAFSDPAALMAA